MRPLMRDHTLKHCMEPVRHDQLTTRYGHLILKKFEEYQRNGGLLLETGVVTNDDSSDKAHDVLDEED